MEQPPCGLHPCKAGCKVASLACLTHTGYKNLLDTSNRGKTLRQSQIVLRDANNVWPAHALSSQEELQDVAGEMMDNLCIACPHRWQFYFTHAIHMLTCNSSFFTYYLLRVFYMLYCIYCKYSVSVCVCVLQSMLLQQQDSKKTYLNEDVTSSCSAGIFAHVLCIHTHTIFPQFILTV